MSCSGNLYPSYQLKEIQWNYGCLASVFFQDHKVQEGMLRNIHSIESGKLVIFPFPNTEPYYSVCPSITKQNLMNRDS